MYKYLLRFSIFILITLILLSIYILIQLSAKNNIIHVTANNYPKILDEVHSNIDKYIGKQISVSGYVYVQDDFQKENFVIAASRYADANDKIELKTTGGTKYNVTQLDISKVVEARIEEILKVSKKEIKNLTNRKIS